LDHNPYSALLLITVLAVVVPILTSRIRRLRLPIVVGEIFAGVIIGHSGFNLVDSSPILQFLAEFGFAYLMFLSGLEVDFNLLLPTRGNSAKHAWWKQPLPVAFILLTGTLGLALLGAYALSLLDGVQNPLLMALILSTTSLGVVVPVLKEREILDSRYGQYLLVAASIADFVTLLLLTIVIAINSQGLTLDLLLIPALLSLFVLAARIGQRFTEAAFLRRILSDLSSATAQIRVRGAFALMVSWVVLAEALGVELILGAFLAGAIASLIAGSTDVESREKLDAIGYGFFIPIFFIMVGVEFDLSALIESPSALLLIPVLVVLAALVKVIPASIFRFQFPWRASLAAGFLLSARLSLIIAAASIARDLGVISEALNAAIILLAIISCTFAPLLFNRLYPKSEEAVRQGVIILGQDQMAEFLAERLLPSGERVSVICPDESRIPAFEKLKVTIHRNCTDFHSALTVADAATARVLLDLTSSSTETLEVCSLARLTFDIPLVISRISDVELIPQLQNLGVKVVQPALATAMALEGAIRYPLAFDILLHDTADVEVGEVYCSNSRLAGIPMRKIRLPGNALILSIQHEESVSVPHSDTVLQLGDRIGLIGSPDSVEQAIALLQMP
jgi:Kef-type K+ transport system membrane component KefB/Trk K+ transport system NAD-binding subunit